MNIKLLFIPLLLFSSQLYAETIHLGILKEPLHKRWVICYN